MYRVLNELKQKAITGAVLHSLPNHNLSLWSPPISSITKINKKNLIFWVEGQLRNLVWLINYLNLLWMKSLILGDFRNANPNFSHSIKTAKYRSPLFRGIIDLWCIIWLQIRPTFIGNWIKGCLTFSDFSCLMLGQEQIPVQPWHSPSCPPDS